MLRQKFTPIIFENCEVNASQESYSKAYQIVYLRSLHCLNIFLC